MEQLLRDFPESSAASSCLKDAKFALFNLVCPFQCLNVSPSWIIEPWTSRSMVRFGLCEEPRRKWRIQTGAALACWARPVGVKIHRNIDENTESRKCNGILCFNPMSGSPIPPILCTQWDACNRPMSGSVKVLPFPPSCVHNETHATVHAQTPHLQLCTPTHTHSMSSLTLHTHTHISCQLETAHLRATRWPL